MKKQIKTSQVIRIDLPPEGEFEDYRLKPGMDYSFSSYNEMGNVTELIRFNDFGDVIGKSVYHYNEKNLLLGEETFDEDGDLEEKITYDRDENGRIIHEFIHYLDDTKDIVSYEYNENSKLIRKTTATDEDEAEREEIFEWDGEKLLVEELIEEGETVRKNMYEYDENGNVLSIDLESEEEESRVENEYDEKGNRIKYLKFDAHGKPVEKHLFTYDDKNRVIGILEEDRLKKNTVQIEYDEMGNAIKQTETNHQGGINHSLERDYDEDGNVTQVRANVGGIPGNPHRKYILVYNYEFYE